MVTIYGVSKDYIDKLIEIGFIDTARRDQGGDYDAELSEEIKVQFHFGTLTLSDVKDTIELDQLEFVKVSIS